MHSTIRSTLIACALIFGLSACNDDGSSSGGGGNGLKSDKGQNSAQFAGTYKGTMQVNYKVDSLKGGDTIATTVVINKNGTVTIDAEGEKANGAANGNQIEVRLKLKESDNGITCEGIVTVKGTVSGNTLSGPINGDADCKMGIIKRDGDLSGTLNAKKTG